MDSYQLLKRSCEEWSTYPSNLLRPDQRRNDLENYRLVLDASERQLFQASTEGVHIIEPSDSPNGYTEQTIANPSALRKHLQQNRKDPQSSLIFINSNGPYTPLNCSRESLTFMCSHYQIPASFLDFVSSFGHSSEPQDYHMSGFTSYDTIENPSSSLLEIQQLGRSGLEQVVQYMLRSVERSTEGTGNIKWEIRQMAVHHKYDFVHRKALWLNVKTNDIMYKRMKEAMAEDPILNSALSKDMSSPFAATLRTHLVHLEWCDKSWREYICDTEAEIRKTLKGLKAAQAKKSPVEHGGGWRQTKISETDGLQRPVSRRLTEEIEDLTYLDRFPFRESEKLNSFFERLEKSLLVIQLNIQTLRDISDHYENLANRDNLPSELVTRSFFSDLDSFSHRIGRIQKNLEIRVTQLKSLMSWLRKERELVGVFFFSVDHCTLLTPTSLPV
ncbi:serine threonine kinase [Fusarium napiforme]|uniref:Serine threonine kinase n=1 Tax=Fusarium napiforme TaxID=42672 RepID=A0A8H5JBB9_9HYPO|nr:serine threonine kinase [Fusarium napiforme]